LVFDPLNGLDDLELRIIRFIGDAQERIIEDHLRILRFFRFFGWYGSGRPDASGLKACAKLKAGLEKISAERIWSELGKLLKAPDPSRTLLWMRTTGVLSTVLPESEKWGIDLIPHLISAEERWGWQADPILRLQAMVRPEGENVTNIARRMRLSNSEAGRLTAWVLASIPENGFDEKQLVENLYYGDPPAIADRYKLELARRIMTGDSDKPVTEKLAEQCAFVLNWIRPILPIKGEHLLASGMAAGPEIGKKLKALEKDWVDSGFKLTREDLLAKI
jgi:poly(A) polymerase